MDPNVVVQLKRNYESGCDTFDEFEKAVGPQLDMPLRKVLGINLLKYSFGIIAADGKVTDEETDAMMYIFDDMGLDSLNSSDDLIQLIQAIGIEEGVPEIFSAAVQIDDALAQIGHQKQLASVLIGLFDEFGNQLIMIDGHEDPRERSMHTQGMQRIRQFVRNHMKGL